MHKVHDSHDLDPLSGKQMPDIDAGNLFLGKLFDLGQNKETLRRRKSPENLTWFSVSANMLSYFGMNHPKTDTWTLGVTDSDPLIRITEGLFT